MFTCCRPFPGITHITDAMGVSLTLVEGEDSALLFDAGYGTEDVAAYVRTLTDRPVELILSHGHHDHVLGARWFDHSLMDPADLEEFRLRTGSAQREKVKNQADGLKVSVPEDFLSAPVPEPQPIRYLDRIGAFDCTFFDLGDREVWLLHVPGHTAGSVVLCVPDLQLLLTGDDWNPCTWMWFPESLDVHTWRNNMQAVLPAAFLDYMTDGRMQAAEKVDMGSPIDTRQISNPEKGWVLLFDAAKQPFRADHTSL